MQRRHFLSRRARLAPQAQAEDDSDLALRVVIAYEDPLTHYWAMELWGRVGDLIGSGGICRTAWRISDLAHPALFTEAVNEAARAHILVVSFRDTGTLPPGLREWVNAWTPRRISTGGALVALIGVPPKPSGQYGQAYAYLETVARQAGLDFLPHERKLPKDLSPFTKPTEPVPTTGCAVALHRRG
jgi:hypothetical protein